MADRIGRISFFSLSPHPQRTSQHWQAERYPGVDGASLWDTGEAGEPFTLRSKSVLATYELARLHYREVKELEQEGAYPLFLNGVLEPVTLFKVLRVEPVDIRAMVGAKLGGDPTTYYGWCELDITLMPINPFAAAPVEEE